jgi:Complex I intermediate-associated protein 30 (CIA30)
MTQLLTLHALFIACYSLKNEICVRPSSSYRSTFDLPSDEWHTIRLPFDQFKGRGEGAADYPLDVSTLKRIGIVAIGREMRVTLAVSGVRLYM